ncbi:MAG: hypothetical protein ACT4OX_00555 [Actinomycetota bacterium]
MQFNQCPYDGNPLTPELMSGGSLVLGCARCGAQWESHGAWVHRITPPNAEIVRSLAGGSTRPAAARDPRRPNRH